MLPGRKKQEFLFPKIVSLQITDMTGEKRKQIAGGIIIGTTREKKAVWLR